MSDIEDARREAEAGLAEAKAQLAAAEEAYRRVVPCEHRTLRVDHGEEPSFHCDDCGVELPDPRGCQHRRIDNDTRQCVQCGERMLLPHKRIETVRSAPNKAACTNPECSGDVYDPNCDNKSRERVVPIMRHYTYTCERCQHDGATFTSGSEPIWDCGHDHRGDSIPIPVGEEQ